jgi:hypothetical protein
MAHQNISFPIIKLIHGFTIETDSPAVVVSNFAKEYRFRRYANEKQKYTFPGRNMTYTDWVVVKAFFDSVGWKKDSFNLTVPGTSVTNTVRLDSLPSITYIALDGNNQPTIVQVSDIVLKQVFNE